LKQIFFIQFSHSLREYPNEYKQFAYRITVSCILPSGESRKLTKIHYFELYDQFVLLTLTLVLGHASSPPSSFILSINESDPR